MYNFFHYKQALNPMEEVKEDDIEEAIKEYIKRRDVDKVIELCESEQLTDGKVFKYLIFTSC